MKSTTIEKKTELSKIYKLKKSGKWQKKYKTDLNLQKIAKNIKNGKFDKNLQKIPQGFESCQK